METLEVNGIRYRVREKELKSKQTDSSPRVGYMRREFAEHPSSGLTPPQLATILKNAEHGDLMAQCYLAEDIEEKDGHIQAELFKRRNVLSGVDWMIEPPTNASAQEQKDAAELEQMVKDVGEWHDLIFGMSDAILKGFSNTEYCWGTYQNWKLPQSLEHRPATWFQLHQDDQSLVVLRDDTGKGEMLKPLNWIQHKHQAKSGYPARIGLVRQLSWPFLFKNYSVRDLAEFLEIYGIPIRIGKYPSGATEDEKRKLLQAVLNIGHNAGGIIPNGMEIDFQEAAKGGGGDPFMTMMSWCERTQSKVILGQTLTAEQGKTGSQALGNVHNEVRMDIKDHDVSQLAATLNRDLIWPMFMLNGKSYTGDKRRMPKLKFDTQEPEDLEIFSRALPELTKIGMQIPLSYAHEKLRIPLPEGNEPVLVLKENEKVLAPPSDKKDNDSAALKLALAALKSRPKPALDKDGEDVFTAQLKAAAGESFSSELLKPIEQMVESAESLETLLDDLLTLESTLKPEQYQALLTQAFAAVELSGRFDVNEGE
ncbi:MAG: DUF935 domain-containing protein [Aliiglaciecola sp.]